VGQVFAGRYELLDPIADGGMGSVWRVLDRRDGQVRAAKLLRQTDASSLLRFIREQATRIHHPHVVTPISWAGEDDTVLFTMPLLRGGSVATLIADNGPLPEHWVAVILDQLLAALEAVHAAGVVHRDVKPANILLEPTGTAPPYARLSDFGIAAPLDQPRLTAASMAIGTPGYMAPEQAMGADPDPKQDTYAAATVGLEMLLAHKPPFTGATLPETPLVRLLEEARDTDPAARMSVSELRRRLVGWLPQGWDPGDVVVLDHYRAEPPTVVEPVPGVTLPAPQGPRLPGAAPTLLRTPSGGLPARAVRPGLVLPAGLAVLGVLLLVAAYLLIR